MDFNKYIGVPWLVGGRTFEGFDCWGLVHLFFKNELHIDIPSYHEAYEQNTMRQTLGPYIKTQLNNWEQVDKWELGNVALINRFHQPIHVGIIAPQNRLLHVESASKLSCMEMISDNIKRRMIGVYRYKSYE